MERKPRRTSLSSCRPARRDRRGRDPRVPDRWPAASRRPREPASSRISVPMPDHAIVKHTALICAMHLRRPCRSRRSCRPCSRTCRCRRATGAARMPVPMRADDAADAVHAEHVERVVVTERVLDRRAGEEAHDAGNEAEHDGAHRASEARRRGDGDEAGDGAGTPPSRLGLPLECSRRAARPGPRRRCDERVDHRQRGSAAGFERRARVEAEPAHPQQRAADQCHRQRMGRHRFLAEADPLADHAARRREPQCRS